MKGLFLLLVAGILAIGTLKDATKDDMAAIQAKNVAVGTAMAAKWNRCEIVHRNGITLRICG